MRIKGNRRISSVIAGLLALVMMLTMLPANTLRARADGDTDAQIKAFVERFYVNILGRASDEAGLADWTNRLKTKDIDGAGLAHGFFFSKEFTILNESLNDTAYCTILYDTFFDRAPDEGGLKDWTGRLAAGQSRRKVLQGFVNSREFTILCEKFGIERGTMNEDGSVGPAPDSTTTPTDTTPETTPSTVDPSTIDVAALTKFVERLYTNVLGRTADADGVKHFVGLVTSGQKNVEWVAVHGFFDSKEFTALNEKLSDAQYVELLYNTFFDRTGDAGGTDHWLKQLSYGAKRKAIIYGFVNGGEWKALLKSYGLEWTAEQTWTDLTYNPFAKHANLKGLQGDNTNYEHGFANVVINDYFSGTDAYAFGGKTYYFNYLRAKSFVENVVLPLNNAGKTLSVVFLLRYIPGSGTEYLVDPASQTAGYAYYMPDTTGDGRQALRAFWSWFAGILKAYDAHIDNWICGNEVNATVYCYESSFDVTTKANKYAIHYYDMYEQVTKADPDARCSIAIDHSWNLTFAPQSVLPAQPFLDTVVNYLNTKGTVNWYISTHMYPARVDNSIIWDGTTAATRSSDTVVFDATNMIYITEYIKSKYGASHRIMLTEQGFCNHQGDQAQAASLAYSYYVAKYNDMIDVFIVNTETVPGGEDFSFLPNASTVWQYLDDGNASHKAWIDSYCLPVIGVNSWADIVPGYAG